MNAQDLKNSILQLAVQGKLVEQRPEEGTAKELLEKIKAEKEQLIKDKKIKKEKPLPEITDEEKPFEIPETWEWVRLGEIGDTNIGLTYQPSDKCEDGTIVLRSSNILNGKMDYDDIVRVSCDIPERARINKGDLLICARNGSRALVGKAAIVDRDNLAFGAFMAKFCSSINEFVYVFVQSALFRSQLDGVKTETINQITQNMLKNQIMPLPPLAEQKRIVAKIEELLPYIKQYDKAYTKLEAFNKKFPEDMKKSILQYAIRGKLVEQRPEEGNAEDLYKRIVEEKAKLIKEGKIKKEKPLPEITEEEIPFEIPANWKWVRLSDIVYNNGQCKPDKKFCYIDIGSIDNKNQRLSMSTTVIDAENAPSRARKVVKIGDIIYSTVRPYLHNMCIIDRDFPYMPIASTGFAVLACLDGIYNKFLFYYMLSPEFDRYANSTENSKGVAYPAINDARLYRTVIPIPPLEEQKRIVARLEEILPYCNQLVK